MIWVFFFIGMFLGITTRLLLKRFLRKKMKVQTGLFGNHVTEEPQVKGGVAEK